MSMQIVNTLHVFTQGAETLLESYWLIYDSNIKIINLSNNWLLYIVLALLWVVFKHTVSGVLLLVVF